MITRYLTSYEGYEETDETTFLFNLRSNGRLKEMMKFEIKERKSPYVMYKKNSNRLITLGKDGQIVLFKKDEKEKSCCRQKNDYFDYHGIKCALCGRGSTKPFIPSRFVVIEMI